MGISGGRAGTKQRQGGGNGESHRRNGTCDPWSWVRGAGKGRDLAGKEGRATGWKQSQLAALFQPLPAHLLCAPPIIN